MDKIWLWVLIIGGILIIPWILFFSLKVYESSYNDNQIYNTCSVDKDCGYIPYACGKNACMNVESPLPKCASDEIWSIFQREDKYRTVTLDERESQPHVMCECQNNKCASLINRDLYDKGYYATEGLVLLPDEIKINSKSVPGRFVSIVLVNHTVSSYDTRSYDVSVNCPLKVRYNKLSANDVSRGWIILEHNQSIGNYTCYVSAAGLTSTLSVEII